MRRQRGEYIENPPDCGVELIIQHDVVVNRGCLEQLIARHGKAPFDVALGRISPPPEPALQFVGVRRPDEYQHGRWIRPPDLLRTFVLDVEEHVAAVHEDGQHFGTKRSIQIAPVLRPLKDFSRSDPLFEIVAIDEVVLPPVDFALARLTRGG